MTVADTSLSLSSPALNFDDVSVVFETPDGQRNTVLSNFSLEVPRGQLVVLVGRSGCGKTTVLNLAAGLISPTSGSVTVLGATPRSARPRLGFMLARDALLPWRTALGNVTYGLELRKMAKAKRIEVARRWLEAVHLGDAEKRWPWQLSQGMRQRVALARTWALDPDLLLMDEPFAALDAQTRESVQEEFVSLWQEMRDRTVLFVTHDIVEALALADRIVLIGRGRILEDVMLPFERPRDVLNGSTAAEFQQLRTSLFAGLR